MPIDLFDIDLQRLIIEQRLPHPVTRAREFIILRLLAQAFFDRIPVNIIHLLHQRTLACYWIGIVVMLPKAVFIVAVAVLPLQLSQRTFKILRFQMVNDLAGHDSI